MAPLALAVLLALSAIAASDSTQITWGSVIFVYHGEKEPTLANDGYSLTSLGANQLLSAGNIVRSRYVSPSAQDNNITSAAPINGMNSYNIDNTMLLITSTDDEFVSGSALAFTQGLYPPHWSYEPEEYLSNGTYLEYPLDGYQYPNIKTTNINDLGYIWVAGNQGCTTYSVSEIQTASSIDYATKIANTTAYYDSIALRVFPLINPGIVSYDNAYDLFEYALYQYNHNESSQITIDDLEQLREYAAEQQVEVNTPNSFGSISSIAGQTAASAVLQQFNGIVGSSGVSDKLTLFFGSYEPFLSFFSLAKLNLGPSASRFMNSLPEHGSIMSFELFSDVEVDPTQLEQTIAFPSTDDLWVRFLFRNGTNETELLSSYALFGRPNDETDMTYSDFVSGMSEFSLNDPSDWCSDCLATTTWCQATFLDNSTNNDDSDTTSNKLSPVIGGVIGATVTIGVLIIIAAILLLLGFRLDYHEKRARGAGGTEGGVGVLKRNGSGGGFKGAEKLASDTDLRLKGGAGATVIRHERVGSWELNESPTDRKHNSLDKAIESDRVKSYARNSEDGIGNVNPFGDPVKPVDQI